MEDLGRIAELQRLCERAYTFICEEWDKDERSKTEYGPNSLLRHLKKASEGEELRDMRRMADHTIKINQNQATTITDLEGKLEKAMRHQNHSYDCVMQNIDCKGECICGLDKQLKETCGE